MQVKNSPSFGNKVIIMDDKSDNPVYVNRSKERDRYYHHNYAHSSGPILPALVGGVATWHLVKKTLSHIDDNTKKVPELVENLAKKFQKAVSPETVQKFVKHKKLTAFVSALTVYSVIKGLTSNKTVVVNNSYKKC